MTTGITAVVIVLLGLIPMSTIVTASVIIREQQEGDIIYPTMTTTTTVEDEDENIVVTPSNGLFLLVERESIKIKKDQNEDQLPSLSNKARSNNKRILIVDDEPDIAFTFKISLEYNGYANRVDVYYDPFLALQEFNPDVYALSIIDIAMPEMDGFTLYTKIRRIDTKIKVFFVTAFDISYEALRGLYPTKDYENVMETILENSGDRLIRKPIDINDLVRRVKAELQ